MHHKKKHSLKIMIRYASWRISVFIYLIFYAQFSLLKNVQFKRMNFSIFHIATQLLMKNQFVKDSIKYKNIWLFYPRIWTTNAWKLSKKRGRIWAPGLHQILYASKNISVRDPNFLRCYQRWSTCVYF